LLVNTPNRNYYKIIKQQENICNIYYNDNYNDNDNNNNINIKIRKEKGAKKFGIIGICWGTLT
jgi:hypothetical protein